MTSTQTIAVGTSDGLHLLGSQHAVELPGRRVNALAQEGPVRWALTGGRSLWRRERGGEWSLLAEIEEHQGRCLYPGPSGLLVGTTEAHLLNAAEDSLRLVASFEEAPSRQEWFTPWGGPPDVRSISSDSDDNLYVNVHVGGILRSGDGGASWRATIDLRADVHQVLAHAESGTLLAPSARGLALSQDGGESWTFQREGLHGTYLRAVAVAGDTALVSASTGAHTNRAAIYRKPVGSTEPFERCRQGLPEWFGANINTYCLAAAGPTVVFGTEEGTVFLSLDRGVNWETLREDLPAVECVAISTTSEG